MRKIMEFRRTERVFIISIRKDIDKGFEFPEPFPLKLRLKDMLDDEVDEKFYLGSTKEYFIKHSFESEEKGNGFRFAPHVKKNANVAKTVTTRAGGRMDDKGSCSHGGRYNDEGEVEQQLEISDREYANSITTVQKDSMVAEKIIVCEATKKGYEE